MFSKTASFNLDPAPKMVYPQPDIIPAILIDEKENEKIESEKSNLEKNGNTKAKSNEKPVCTLY